MAAVDEMCDLGHWVLLWFHLTIILQLRRKKVKNSRLVLQKRRMEAGQVSMNWDDMRVFLQVARRNSLTAASKQLGLDPSTLGRRITRLEEKLSARLFARTPQGYDLTEAGQRLLDLAEQMEIAASAATAQVGGQSDTLSGTIRIGAPDGCANYVLPKVCSRISRENPDLDIQIVALPRVLNLSKREADIAVTVSPPTAGRMVVQRITNYALHLVAAQRYLDAHGPIETVEQISGHPVIGYIPDLIFDKELDYLSKVGKSVVPALASNSVSVQINLLNQAAGIGIAHDFTLKQFPDLVKILTEQVSLTRSFYLVRHQADTRVGRQNRFAKMLSEGIRSTVRELEHGV
jgi:DNA-binding transcriptional LysR family regulator